MKTILQVFIAVVLAIVAAEVVLEHTRTYFAESPPKPPSRNWPDDLFGTTLVMPPLVWTFSPDDKFKLDVLGKKQPTHDSFELYTKIDATGKDGDKLDGIIVLEYTYIHDNWYHSGTRAVRANVTQPTKQAPTQPETTKEHENIQPQFRAPGKN